MDGSLAQQPSDVGRHYVADAAVRRTDDFTALDDVPDGNAVGQEKVFFLLHRCGRRFFCYM